MSHRGIETTAARMSWRRRLALGLTLGMVAIVVCRFSAVMLRRAAVQALEDSGWTIVYEQTPPDSSAWLDRITAQLGRAGPFVAGMLGRDPEIVEVRIADMQAPVVREAELSMLKQLPSLRRLALQREALSPSDVESIGAVEGLRELTIASDALTDQSLSALAGLSRLRRLSAGQDRVQQTLALALNIDQWTSTQLRDLQRAVRREPGRRRVRAEPGEHPVQKRGQFVIRKRSLGHPGDADQELAPSRHPEEAPHRARQGRDRSSCRPAVRAVATLAVE